MLLAEACGVTGLGIGDLLLIPRSPQVKQNLLSVSYHIAQYTSIIADLRGEIQRLKRKIDEQGGRGRARFQPERGNIRPIPGVRMGLG